EGLQWLELALSQGTAAPASRRDPAAAEGAEAAMRAGGRRAPADPRAARAKVALGAARIAWEQHQSEQEKKSASWCQSRLEESVALYREAGDRYGVADALSALGLLARRQAGKDRRFGVDPERGTALLEESLTLAREVGDPWLIACILERLATTADLQRDAERARAEESLRLFQEVGDTLEIAIVQRVPGQRELAPTLGAARSGRPLPPTRRPRDGTGLLRRKPHDSAPGGPDSRVAGGAGQPGGHAGAARSRPPTRGGGGCAPRSNRRATLASPSQPGRPDAKTRSGP